LNSAFGILAEGRKPFGSSPGSSRRAANNEVVAEQFHRRLTLALWNG